jgi:2-methylaconitate cis-trans-isomerase PrpF
MSNAFLLRMPGGIAGDVSRKGQTKIEGAIFDAAYPCLHFGDPVKKVSGKIRPMAESDSGQPYGFLVRPFPGQMASSEAIGAATPDVTQPASVMVSGYMTVEVVEGSPAENGTVYYRSQAGSPAANVGRLETDSSGSPTTNIAITNCVFMGTKDDNGVVEIKFNV